MTSCINVESLKIIFVRTSNILQYYMERIIIVIYKFKLVHMQLRNRNSAGADPGGGGAPGARPPKIGKKYDFFGVKSWFFTRNTPKIFVPPSAIGKNMIFGVKSWFFTRNTPKIFAPPSARRNFFKCAPANLKFWIRPCSEHSTLILNDTFVHTLYS